MFANDIDASSKHIYEHNIKHTLTLDDILNINDIPEHDILTGGFPCQPFSIAGQQKGFNDTRSNVFWKIHSIIQEHTPRLFILENVKHLLTHDNKKTFGIIKEQLKSLNYHLVYTILDTCKITPIPQHRERLYIVGILKHDSNDSLIKHFNLDFETIETLPLSHFLE